MTDLPTVASILVANHRTIKTPAKPIPALHPGDNNWIAVARANYAASREASDRLYAIRSLLHSRRYQFLDRLEADPDGGWRIHVFPIDPDAVVLLEGLADCGAGDPATFDPEEFLFCRLQEVEPFDIP